MKQYKSTAIVHAEPNNLVYEYDDVGVSLVGDEGYQVIYDKGLKTELSIWMAKALFEKNFAEWSEK